MGIGLLATATVAGCANHPAAVQSTNAPSMPVETALVSAPIGERSTLLTATLAAEKESVISAEVADKITVWPVKLGQSLRAGDLIAELDTRAIAAQVAQAQGQVTQAEAEVRRLTAEYERAAQETSAQVVSAEAGIREAEANRLKADTFTRTQELQQAQAKLAQAHADEALARKEWERYTDLVASGAAARQTLDQVQARYDVARQQVVLAEQSVSLAKEGARMEDRAIARSQVAQARAALTSAQTRPAKLAAIRSAIVAAQGQLDSARATLRQAQVQLSKHRITAPFAGRVLSVKAELGELATPGTNLIVLGSTSKLKLQFSVPEQDRPHFRQRQVAFTVDSLGGRTFTASVSTPGFLGDQRTRNFAFEGTVDNPQEALLPGMIAKVSLNLGHRTEGVRIPIDALVFDGTEASAYVVADGRVQRRRVLVGDRESDQAIVRDGLAVGEHVVRSPRNLVDGGKVTEVAK